MEAELILKSKQVSAYIDADLDSTCGNGDGKIERDHKKSLYLEIAEKYSKVKDAKDELTLSLTKEEQRNNILQQRLDASIYELNHHKDALKKTIDLRRKQDEEVKRLNDENKSITIKLTHASNERDELLSAINLSKQELARDKNLKLTSRLNAGFIDERKTRSHLNLSAHLVYVGGTRYDITS